MPFANRRGKSSRSAHERRRLDNHPLLPRAVRVVQNYNVMGVASCPRTSVRYLASDLGAQQIRVNAISAGPVKTASARGIKRFSKVLEGVAAIAPLRRNTDPAEVADTAVFLSSSLGRG